MNIINYEKLIKTIIFKTDKITDKHIEIFNKHINKYLLEKKVIKIPVERVKRKSKDIFTIDGHGL